MSVNKHQVCLQRTGQVRTSETVTALRHQRSLQHEFHITTPRVTTLATNEKNTTIFCSLKNDRDPPKMAAITKEAVGWAPRDQIAPEANTCNVDPSDQLVLALHMQLHLLLFPQPRDPRWSAFRAHSILYLSPVGLTQSCH